MNAPPAVPTQELRFGAPGGNDAMRSPDEVRIINEMANEEVEQFLTINQIDPSAARELRNEPPHVALAVIDRGALKACTNPSGALVARIRDAKRGVLPAAPRPVGSAVASLDPEVSELDRFLSENLIDHAGIVSLRAEAREIQKIVMAKGPLTRSTNPSASLMARIRNVKAEMQPSGVVNVAPPPPALLPPLPPPPPPAVNGSAVGIAPGGAGIGGDSLNIEALKAIEKLNAKEQSSIPVLTNETKENNAAAVSNQISNGEDKKLQEEAFMAYQALNDTTQR